MFRYFPKKMLNFLKTAEVIENSYEKQKKHEIIAETQKLRMADILSTAQDSTAHDITPQRDLPSFLYVVKMTV